MVASKVEHITTPSGAIPHVRRCAALRGIASNCIILMRWAQGPHHCGTEEGFPPVGSASGSIIDDARTHSQPGRTR
eukprot:8625962-Pyramimonas_sp.AAC.1